MHLILILYKEVGRRLTFQKEGSFWSLLHHNFCVHLKKNYRILVFMNCKRWVKNLYKKNLIHTLSVKQIFVWECDELTYFTCTIQMRNYQQQALSKLCWVYSVLLHTVHETHFNVQPHSRVFQYFVGFPELYDTPFESFSCVITVRHFLNSWIDSSPHPRNFSRVIFHD